MVILVLLCLIGVCLVMGGLTIADHRQMRRPNLAALEAKSKEMERIPELELLPETVSQMTDKFIKDTDTWLIAHGNLTSDERFKILGDKVQKGVTAIASLPQTLMGSSVSTKPTKRVNQQCANCGYVGGWVNIEGERSICPKCHVDWEPWATNVEIPKHECVNCHHIFTYTGDRPYGCPACGWTRNTLTEILRGQTLQIAQMSQHPARGTFGGYRETTYPLDYPYPPDHRDWIILIPRTTETTPGPSG